MPLFSPLLSKSPFVQLSWWWVGLDETQEIPYGIIFSSFVEKECDIEKA